MLRDQIGIFHACLAQAFLALLVFIGIVRSELWLTLPAAGTVMRPAMWIACAATIAIYVQLALGATMRHQHRDLSILDFPTANGAWLPDTSPEALARINAWRDARGYSDVTAAQIWLQMAHRFVAGVIAIGVFATGANILRHTHLPMLRRLGIVWMILLCVQLTLGAWTIWSNKAADIATSHVAVGAAMLALGVSICAIWFRLMRIRHAVAMTGLEPVSR
jgi:cytochrome c oxidase assembly protein subunit 15